MSTSAHGYRDLFFGREAELQLLQQALDGALAGRGSFWMLAGEPGIGKTRATEEISRQAQARGTVALWSRCWEDEGAPVFWPWIQLIRAYLRDCDGPSLMARLGVHAHAIAEAIPELGAIVSPPPAQPLEGPEGRFRFFDAVVTLLRQAAHEQPLLLVLDDLHWADIPSLVLLRFVARELRAERILLIATFRAVEASAEGPRSAALADLGREGTRLDLRGLSEAELGKLVAAAVDSAPPSGWVIALHRQTEGNPFFVHELLALLIADDGMHRNVSDLGVPLGVRQAIRRRLERLSADCQAMLALAAVIGREVDASVLQALAAQEDERLAPSRLRQLLDEATREDIIRRQRLTERIAFTHALIREALYEDLSSDMRAQCHGRTATLLENLWANDLEPHLGELAYHFSRAATAEAGQKALHYMVRAGDRSARLLAYEDAAAHYQAALSLLARGVIEPTVDAVPDAVQRRRCELLLALGDMDIRAGARQQAIVAYREAIEVAQRVGAPDLLARGVVGMPLSFTPGRADHELLALLEVAVRTLPAADSALRVSLLTRLVVELYFSDDADRCPQVSQEAVDIARRLGDPATLAMALIGRHWALWNPDGAHERAVVAEEMIRLAERAGDRERLLAAHTLRAIDHLELGDLRTASVAIAAVERLAQALRQPQFLNYPLALRAMGALLEGRFADAERLATEALQVGLGQNPNAALVYGAQIFACRLAQGRISELEGTIEMLARQAPDLAALRCTRAFIYSQTGREAEARAELVHLAHDDFAAVRRDGNWLQSMVQLAVVAAVCDSPETATVYQRLLPYADHNVVGGGAAVCSGSVSHWLGELAASLARWDDAQRHFDAALHRHEEMGAPALIAHTRRAHAEMLLRRGEPADMTHARTLLEAAAQTYRALEMPTFVAQAERALADVSMAGPAARAGSPAAESHPAGAAQAFVKQGDVWMIAYAGTVVRLRDAKGLHYLAHLLRYPGRDWHVFDLAASAARLADGSEPVLRSQSTMSSGPDAHAKRAYAQRLAALRDEVENAEDSNDTARAAAARDEIVLLTVELGRAYRLGAPREPNEPLEKARKAVSNRLRAALGRLDREHPVLGRHLTLNVRIGTYCSYRPEHPPDWQLD